MSITIENRSGDSTGVDIADPTAAPAPCRRPCGVDVRAVMLPLTVVCGAGGGPCGHPKNCGWPTCAC